MPTLLTVVVPAYRVQGYIRECVESILGARERELEVIAIDDCSPDGTGAVLDEVAARDRRLRVLHLEANVGLGQARNIGLEEASGDYVWFVDGDDWVKSAGVDIVCERLRLLKPDILIFDYARAYWNNSVRRSVISDLLRTPPPPETFTLAERPSVMQLMMTGWNRAFRREFLLQSELRFGHGYYEDVRVTYPTLMLAERISLLDEVVYYYRQRRRGAITRTTNDKHFVAFGEYEAIFDFMDRHAPLYEEFRPLMFYRTFWHLLIILSRGGRIPKSRRRDYFRQMSQHYRQWKPAGYTRPAGREGIWERLVEADGYRRYAVSVRLFHYLDRGRRVVSRLRKRLPRWYKAAKLRGLFVYYAIQRRLPIDENLAVYAAYWYRNATCNPRAIYLKARELVPEIRGAWIVKVEGSETVPPDAQHVLPNTREYFKVLARAKYFVNNVNFPDGIVKRDGQIHVQTQHGTPLKVMGLDQQKFPVGAGDTDFAAMLKRSDRWDYHLSQNRFSTEVWERSFPCNYEILESGYPRNDVLFRTTNEEIARLREQFGIGPDQVAVLYAPTHRDYMRSFRTMLDLPGFARALGPKFVILVRAHYYYSVRRFASPTGAATVVNVSRYPYIEDLMLAADALLTDYSSIMFDYAALDRPIVVFANDWDTYVRTRGVNFDLVANPPGAVAVTETELADVFTSGDYAGPAATKAREEFRRQFCELDDGQAAERVVRHVFLGQPMSQVAFPAEADPVERASLRS